MAEANVRRDGSGSPRASRDVSRGRLTGTEEIGAGRTGELPVRAAPAYWAEPVRDAPAYWGRTGLRGTHRTTGGARAGEPAWLASGGPGGPRARKLE